MAITLNGSTGGTASAGWYAQSAFTGTFSDGIVLDYTTGMGRISVGASDGLTVYNGGVASSALLTIDSSGNVGIGTSSPAAKLDVSLNTVTPNHIAGTGIALDGADNGTTRFGLSAFGITNVWVGSSYIAELRSFSYTSTFATLTRLLVSVSVNSLSLVKIYLANCSAPTAGKRRS